MTRRRRTGLAVMAASMVVLGLTGGYYINWSGFVGTLTANGTTLTDRDGRAILANDDPRSGWRISAPFIRNAKGLYLVAGQKADDPLVGFSDQAGEASQWVFTVLNHFRPEPYKNSSKGDAMLMEGGEGLEFHLQPKHGPHAGKFLAFGPAPEDGSQARPLAFSAERKVAVRFTYVEILHKPRDGKK